MNRTMNLSRLLPACGLAALVAGCAATGRHAETEPPPRPLEAAYLPAGAADETGARADDAEETIPDALRLADALALALRGNPELAAFSHETRAAEARVLQARQLPNPELEVGVSEFDRGGEGFDSAETELGIGQLLEWGGKRHWRTQVAKAGEALAGWDYESKRRDVFVETTRRVVNVLAAQQRVALSALAVEAAEKTANAVEERVNAGKEPPFQATKANAERELARMQHTAMNNALDAARARLAAMWGETTARFKTVAGTLDGALAGIPALEHLQSLLAASPELARWESEIRLAEASLAAEKAARMPDLDVSAGLQRFEEDGSDAVMFGVALPLPLFDRNRGAVAAAYHGLEKVRALRRAAQITRHAELAQAHADYASAHQRVETLRTRVVPAMEQAFASAQEGYRQGKFGFLDMLDAQRGLFEARAGLIDAQADYHHALAELERITATSLQNLINT